MTPIGQIEHVVLLMLENRSLDSLLGWLYENDLPAQNIPPLRPGERPYEGLQNLDLSRYVNVSSPIEGEGQVNHLHDSDLKYNITLTFRGVLVAGNVVAGNWADKTLLARDDTAAQRAAVIRQLVNYSNQGEAFYRAVRGDNRETADDKLIGMAGAILFLLGHGNRDRAFLQQNEPVHAHRNTLITVLGNIHEARRQDKQPGLPDAPSDPAKVRGWLQSKTTKELVALATNGQAWLRLKIAPIRGANALNSPNFSPGETFSEVARQHYGGKGATGADAGKPPAMRGFVEDYVQVLKHHRKCSDDQVITYAQQVMQSYTPDQLPVLNGLAKHYAVCDMWFSSVPSQTNSNRAFAFCGTSKGLVNNGYLEEDRRAKPVEKLVGYLLGDDRFHAKTLVNALADGNTSWKIFYRSGMLQENIKKLIDVYRGQAAVASTLAIAVPWYLRAAVWAAELASALYLVSQKVGDPELSYMRSLSDGSVDSMYTYRMFPELAKLRDAKANCEKFEKFDEAARAGKLPNFTFIEPVWSISPRSTGATVVDGDFLYHLGDDYHPPGNLDAGETLVRSVYSSLIANKEAWSKTLLIITFDEPVGAFDHVPPPAAVPPWGNGTAPHACEQGFKFDRYGGRVPTLLVSPLIEKGTVFRSPTGTPYDHTSLIATILKWRGLKNVAEFGERAARAPTFEHVLTRTQPRTDAEDVEFLRREKREIGSVVRYHDRFCLVNESGDYLASFVEDFAGGALLGGAIVEQDGAITEYFPTLSKDAAKKTELYFVNPDNRADAGQILRHRSRTEVSDRSRVKIAAVDHGLGSYNVLGAWKDSRDCYYSNDYLEGKNDIKERWILHKADRDNWPYRDGVLQYGDRVTIESEHWRDQFLSADGRWLTTSGTDAMWRVMPVATAS